MGVACGSSCGAGAEGAAVVVVAVSYTHLTLPTLPLV